MRKGIIEFDTNGNLINSSFPSAIADVLGSSLCDVADNDSLQLPNSFSSVQYFLSFTYSRLLGRLLDVPLGSSCLQYIL